MKPVLFFFLFILSTACSGRGSSSGTRQSTHGETPCQPPNPHCTRLLPDKGTFDAKLKLRTTARSTPAPPPSGRAGEWTVAQMESAIEETIHVRRDERGHLFGKRELTPDEGFHFTMVDKQICLGFRYEPPICRPPDENEVEQRLSDLLGIWEDVLSFLGDQTDWQPQPGKDKTQYKLVRKESSGKNNGKIRDMSGFFKMDPTAGVIDVKVRYKLDAERKDGLLYTLEVEYEHRIRQEATPVVIPENAITQDERQRSLLDRRVLLGEFTPHSLRDLYRTSSGK